MSFAKDYNVIVVLKGHKTIVASPNGDLLYNDALGNAGMATGGSGDVLAGVIASLTARDLTRSEARALVCIFMLSPEISQKKNSEKSQCCQPISLTVCRTRLFQLSVNSS